MYLCVHAHMCVVVYVSVCGVRGVVRVCLYMYVVYVSVCARAHVCGVVCVSKCVVCGGVVWGVCVYLCVRAHVCVCVCRRGGRAGGLGRRVVPPARGLVREGIQELHTAPCSAPPPLLPSAPAAGSPGCSRQRPAPHPPCFCFAGPVVGSASPPLCTSRPGLSGGGWQAAVPKLAQAPCFLPPVASQRLCNGCTRWAAVLL